MFYKELFVIVALPQIFALSSLSVHSLPHRQFTYTLFTQCYTELVRSRLRKVYAGKAMSMGTKFPFTGQKANTGLPQVLAREVRYFLKKIPAMFFIQSTLFNQKLPRTK